MKIGIFSDIHANLPALETIINHFNNYQLDQIIHLGDAVGIGPFPNECLELMASTNKTNILGNHDLHIIDCLSTKPDNMSTGEFEYLQWAQGQISDFGITYLKKSGLCISMQIFDIQFTFLHYGFIETDHKSFAPIIKNPGPENLDVLFSEINSDVIFYGHQHLDSDIQGMKRYINPGSAGCFNRPESRCMVLNVDKNEYSVEKFSFKYDDKSLFEQIEASNLPNKQIIKSVFFPR